VTVLTLFCAGLAVWLWLRPSDQVRRRLEPPVDQPSPASDRAALRRALLCIGAIALVMVLRLVAGPAAAALGLAGVIAAGAAIRLAGLGRRTGVEQAARAEVANGCSIVANQVRVGRIPAEALGVAAEDAPVLAVAARVQQNGGDVVAALLGQADRPGCRGLRDLARAWQVGTRTGAPMADLLDQVATSLRCDQAVERTVAAELAGPRATGRVMAVLPLCGIALGYLLGGDPIGFLVAGPLGWACLVGGAGLAACGVLWIEWLARQVGRAA
jgi:tight adherence protein B